MAQARRLALVSLLGLACPTGALELRAALLARLSAVPDRGAAALAAEDLRASGTSVVRGESEAEAIAGLVAGLEPVDPAARDGWMVSDDFPGLWQLRYTCSRTFHANGGLTGYAEPGASTPELRMRVAPSTNGGLSGELDFEEPVVRSDGATPRAECVTTSAAWASAADDVLKVTTKQICAGERSWSPSARARQGEVDFDRDKAVRVLSALRPVYLDGSLLLLRSQTLRDVVWCFTREGT